jgi:hypothetical protein
MTKIDDPDRSFGRRPEGSARSVGGCHPALREADVGDFASDDAVAAMRRKWTEDAP